MQSKVQSWCFDKKQNNFVISLIDSLGKSPLREEKLKVI